MNEMNKLNDIIKSYGKCAIAFSGGVDSTFLLAAAIKVLGKENVTAITVIPPYVAKWEISEAAVLAEKMGVNHINITTAMIDEVKDNPSNRCYVCKTALFTTMLEKCRELDIDVLCDGSNADDTKDFRPGMKALKELKIHSPMVEAQMTKQQIRDVSLEWKLDTWDKPPYACLLTRIPHDTKIARSILERIEKSEVAMMEIGFPYVRVRHHGEIARIEIPRDHFSEFVTGGFYEDISEKLKSYGYQFVTLDLGGYKMGSMNRNGE
ncbi:MAG: ATP-dependent sacrificial sulfur transferase LarE [Spirochaetaceae bacterium]|jgi:uncharacterized protein|nr:ATP-dependent sacrificial sulfur transferase LarE [Spirochaetaceae bacterium]